MEDERASDYCCVRCGAARVTPLPSHFGDAVAHVCCDCGLRYLRRPEGDDEWITRAPLRGLEPAR